MCLSLIAIDHPVIDAVEASPGGFMIMLAHGIDESSSLGTVVSVCMKQEAHEESDVSLGEIGSD